MNLTADGDSLAIGVNGELSDASGINGDRQTVTSDSGAVICTNVYDSKVLDHM